MKVLVTGANGYLGSGVVKKLLDNNVEVIAADISDEFIDRRAKIFCCDIFKIDNPLCYFDNPDIVLHMAWKNGFVHNDDSHILDLPNHFIFAQKIICSDIKKFVCMGTMHEIGFFEGSINENTPTNPQSLYGIAKNSLRNITQILCKNNNVIWQWLRGFYIVGNNIYGSNIFSKIIKADMENKINFPFTMGLNQWDFVDYDVFCNQVVASILQDNINGIINICSGRPEKLADRVERFIKENNLHIKLSYGEFPDRVYDSKAVWGDDAKIKMIMER